MFRIIFATFSTKLCLSFGKAGGVAGALTLSLFIGKCPTKKERKIYASLYSIIYGVVYDVCAKCKREITHYPNALC